MFSTFSYKKFIKELENKGITVVSISDIIHYQNHNKIVKNENNTCNNTNTTNTTKIVLSFDDKIYPEVNCLYFNLYNGQYYNDTIYVKKKVEKEREMLLLLAGKLGVKELSYYSIITETTFSQIDCSVNIKGFENKIQYKKEIKEHNSINGCEVYQNRGAPVYLNSKTKDDLNKNIENSLGTMTSNIFSYDYYQTNAKLEAFVYKRFVFKMEKMEYTIDIEDISDKSFNVKACFMNYGLSVRVDKNISYSEKINYKFVFFNNKELQIKLMEITRRDTDEFLLIKEKYDDSQQKDKDQEVHYISDYVKKEALELNYINALNNYIIDDGFEKYYNVCHTFGSTSQIRDWLYNLQFEYNKDNVKCNENSKNENTNNENTKTENSKNENSKNENSKNENNAIQNNENNSFIDIMIEPVVPKTLKNVDIPKFLSF
jgi:hypothetical protein